MRHFSVWCNCRRQARFHAEFSGNQNPLCHMHQCHLPWVVPGSVRGVHDGQLPSARCLTSKRCARQPSCRGSGSHFLPVACRGLDQLLTAARNQRVRQLRKIQQLRKQNEVGAAHHHSWQMKQRREAERLQKIEDERQHMAQERLAKEDSLQVKFHMGAGITAAACTCRRTPARCGRRCPCCSGSSLKSC